MANQIEIFRVDFGDTINSIEKLKIELKETRKLFEAAKPNTEDFVKYSSEVKRLDGTIKTLNATTKDQVNGLGGINQAAKFASGSYGELKQKIDAQKKSLLELNVESEDFANAQKELITLQNQRIEIEKKIPSLFQERIKGAIDESNALKQLKAELREANAAALNGDGKAAARAAELRDKLEDLKDTTTSLKGSGVERLNTSVGLLSQGFQDFDADKIKTGFKGIGAAMSAIPLVLLIEGIKALVDNFDEVIKFAQELTGYVDENAKAVENLTNEIKLQEAANIGLISSIENEIAIMTAQGLSQDEILKKKKELVAFQVKENEKNIELNKAKKKQLQEEGSLYETSRNTILTALGLQTAALIKSVESEKERGLKVAEVNTEIAKSEASISKLKTSLTVDEINNNKKKIEAAKKTADAKKKIEDKTFEDTKKGNEETLNYIIDLDKTFVEEQKKINKSVEDGNQQSLDIIKGQNEKYYNDKIKIAETDLLNLTKNNGYELEAKLNLLNAQRDLELEHAEGDAVAVAEIKAKYRQYELKANEEQSQKELAIAGNLTNSLGDLSNALFDLKRSNLVKGSEEDKEAAKKQFEVNKAFSIASTLIAGAQAVISASASVPYLPVGLAASIAVTAATAANLIKISNTKFQYFDGGFTKQGDPTQQAESIGNAQFHNDEYVVPSKVKNLPSAIPHITQLERMRQGYSKSNISGFYDGGFTQRSVSSTAMSNSNLQDIITSTIASMPTPIVKVTDINKVSKRNEVSINVSGL